MRRARRGLGWESRLQVWHDHYRRRRLAWVTKTDPPTKLARGRLVYERKAPPDFVGCLKGGRAVVFDAKDCTRSRWPLGEFKDHQAKDLEAVWLLKGAAFVALRMGGRCWVLWWSALRPLWWRWRSGDAARGEASLTVEQVAELGEEMGEDGWLEVVL